jgi:hypothetical protein
MNLIVRLALIAVALSLPAIAALAQGFTPELFKQFVEMRVGTGEPVYWYCIGELYSYPDGKLLAKVEGLDTARLVKSETKTDRAMQISRKVFVYRDPGTNEVLKTVKGKLVQHIEYPYQQITYVLGDLKTWLYEHFFATWLSPVNASLAYALAYVLLWLGLMTILYRRRIFIKV